MTGNEYQDLAMRTNDGGCWDRIDDVLCSEYMGAYKYADLINGVMGLNGEAGEVIDMVKKFIYHGHKLNIDEIKKELGDVMWYVAMCCNALNISLDDVMQGNIDKLKKRYPDGFSEQASINRMVEYTE
jgi:NTP pyrophosphatase (non-canonical NTP hydrolase)